MAVAKAYQLGSWKELYQAALVQRDRTKLTELLAALEAAIVRRRKELSNSEGTHQEFADMVLAAQVILKIKTEQLGWPPVGSCVKRSKSFDVLDKLRRIESIHHWHRGKK